MTAQTLNIFDGLRDEATPQQENEERCMRIAPHILSFCRSLWDAGRSEFRMGELTDYVMEREVVAPDSAGRILRKLRREGRVGYKVVSRAKSLYRLTRVTQ